METTPLLAWTLVAECPMPPDVQQMLVQGDQAVDWNSELPAARSRSG